MRIPAVSKPARLVTPAANELASRNRQATSTRGRPGAPIIDFRRGARLCGRLRLDSSVLLKAGDGTRERLDVLVVEDDQRRRTCARPT